MEDLVKPKPEEKKEETKSPVDRRMESQAQIVDKERAKKFMLAFQGTK